MKLMLALPLFSLSVIVPLAFFAGQMAKSYGRKFWTWFFIGMLLPLVANFIIFSLPPVLSREKKEEIPPVENEELFNHLFTENINKKRAA